MTELNLNEIREHQRLHTLGGTTFIEETVSNDLDALLAEVERLRSELREYGTEVGRLRAADFRVRELLDRRAPEGHVTECWISPGAVRRALDGEEGDRDRID